MKWSHFSFSCFRFGLLAFAAMAFSGAASAQDLTRPAFKTLIVGSCPAGRTVAEEPRQTCSRARLLYPLYSKSPWLNKLIAQSVILPMFAQVLDEKSPRPFTQKNMEARYKAALTKLIQNRAQVSDGGEKISIDFTATLTGHGESERSPAGQPRPRQFGPYLQFSFVYELAHGNEAHPPAPSGAFIVIDTRARKILSFDDLILPGQERALENLQRDAFRTYLEKNQGLSAEAAEEHLANPAFAFHMSKDWRIADGGLIFRFAMYDVGPRTFGMPEIFVARHYLQGLIQPTVLKQIP